ncbi:hypothetical protein Zmor_007482 [Zophobas morio]|uniref:Gustatory receptor n=1 Tax=Zophobas morio TaxID=2755281 RepID=A0AA38IZB9_9CUCU|nr:hypothetical protein Zmor_007482 [Zophobas morio]
MQLNLSKLVLHGNALLHILATKKLYEIDEFINDKFRENVRLIVDGSYPSYLGLCLLLTGKTFYQYQILTVGKVCDLLTLLIFLLTYFSTFVVVLTMVEAYFLLFGKCQHQMKMVIAQRDIFSARFLKRRLRKLQKLHMVLSLNFQIIQETFNFSLLLFWFGGTTIMIGNIFGLSNYVFYDEELSENAIVTLVVSVFGALSTTYLIFKLDKLGNVSEDILSFLFQCPVSKLNPLESAQIEMLIYTLTLQKPVLKASDIFVLKTGLIASVSGTILTYVLVALQFHAVWSKK